MPTPKIVRNFLVLSLIFSFVFTPLRFDSFNLKNSSVRGDVEILIEEDTFWGKNDNIVLEKNVRIKNGATLTIEKGSTIIFANEPVFLTVSNGNIIAEGSQEEKITFKTRGDPYWDTYGIFFHDEESEKTSFFRYVEFENGGFYPYVLYKEREGFLKKAYASDYFGAVINYRSGKVHIENSSFTNSFSGHIYANFYEDEDYPEGNYLEIANSNFEKSASDIAVSAQKKCEEACKTEIILKNNWYGDEMGPEYGQEVLGDCEASGFRKKDLIADPTVVIPGITGSAQVDGEWKIDPILHNYDDLLESLEENGYEDGKNLFDFPYDWRNSNEVSANYLQAKIEGIIQETRVSKVDLVAHSMGGLVARAYIEEMADGVEYDNTVDQLFTMGTPHRGASKTYLSWEGAEFGTTFEDWLMKHHFNQEAKHNGYSNIYDYVHSIVNSTEELLPIDNYLFDTETDSLRIYHNDYPQNNFLEELNLADNIEKMGKVNFINMVGVLENKENTLSKIRVIDSTVENRWEHGMPENFGNQETDQGLEYGKGDGTVTEKSAEISVAQKIIRTNTEHRYLPVVSQCEILREFSGKEECKIVDKTRFPNLLLFNLFSPIDIQVVSPSGQWTGKNIQNLSEDKKIPLAYYSGFEMPCEDNPEEMCENENEFLTIPNPENGEYEIITQGTGEGGDYRIEMARISENEENGQASEIEAKIEGVSVLGQTEEKVVEVTEKEIIAEEKPPEPVTLESLRKKVEKFAREGLIKKKSEKVWLLGEIEILKRETELLEMIKNNPFIKKKFKKTLVAILEKQIENRIDFMIGHIEKNKKNYDATAKNVLVGDLERIKAKNK